MQHSKLRRQIAWEAARLMYSRQESEYFRAKIKAGRQLCRGWVKPADLPSNAEIRDQVQTLARLYEGDSRSQDLRDMRLENKPEGVIAGSLAFSLSRSFFSSVARIRSTS